MTPPPITQGYYWLFGWLSSRLMRRGHAPALYLIHARVTMRGKVGYFNFSGGRLNDKRDAPCGKWIAITIPPADELDLGGHKYWS